MVNNARDCPERKTSLIPYKKTGLVETCHPSKEGLYSANDWWEPVNCMTCMHGVLSEVAWYDRKGSTGVKKGPEGSVIIDFETHILEKDIGGCYEK